MSGSAVNVARYSFLALGIGYGFMHQRSIYKQVHEHEVQAEADHKEKLMAKAKEAWLNRHLPASAKKSDGVITNPDDPKFDLEKYLMKIEKDDMSSRAKA